MKSIIVLLLVIGVTTVTPTFHKLKKKLLFGSYGGGVSDYSGYGGVGYGQNYGYGGNDGNIGDGYTLVTVKHVPVYTVQEVSYVGRGGLNGGGGGYNGGKNYGYYGGYSGGGQRGYYGHGYGYGSGSYGGVNNGHYADSYSSDPNGNCNLCGRGVSGTYATASAQSHGW